MAVTDEVLCYLEKEYDPLAVILYGSFADGTQDAESDFDALVITRDRKKHDTSRVGDTVLDVFVWPEEEVLTKNFFVHSFASLQAKPTRHFSPRSCFWPSVTEETSLRMAEAVG